MSDRDEGVILVVEDDPAVRNLVTCALDVHGYRSREASTATAALADLTCARDVNLVILDLGLSDRDGSVRKAVRSAARVDVVVIVAEAVAAAGLLAFALGSDHAGVRASATSLMHGPAALPWWAAFVACGLAAALAVEVGCLVRGHGRSRSAAKAVAKAYPTAALALAAALVLVGALGLRAAVVEAGAQRPLELQEAEAPASVPSENEEAAGLRSAPSAEKSGGEGSATEREDVTLWSN